jgi:hypothetical protein
VKLYLHSPNTPSWRGAHLKHRDNFTFNTADKTNKIGLSGQYSSAKGKVPALFLN